MATRLFRVGFITTDTPGDLISLSLPQGITATNYQTLQSGGVNYTVPVGKTLYIGEMLISGGGAAGDFTEFGYSLANVSNSGSAPSSPTKIYDRIVGPASLGAFPFIAVIPSNNAPYIRVNVAASSAIFYGIVY